MRIDLLGRKKLCYFKAVNVAFDIVYFEMASLHPASKIRKLYKSIEITPRVLILVVFFFT